MSDHTELTDRFDWMRNSGICSPTTRGLLDDAQAALEQTVKERDEARAEVIDQGIRLQQWEESAEKMNAHCDIIEERVRDAEAERDALADRIERAKAAGALWPWSDGDQAKADEIRRILSEGEAQ